MNWIEITDPFALEVDKEYFFWEINGYPVLGKLRKSDRFFIQDSDNVQKVWAMNEMTHYMEIKPPEKI